MYINNSEGFVVVDARKPTNPSIAKNIDDYRNVSDVAIQGNYAYVALGGDGPIMPTGFGAGVAVVDITNPHKPIPVGHVSTEGAALGIAVRGKYAYVADYGGLGLVVIDISNPKKPSVVGSFQPIGNKTPEFYDVALKGDYVYVIDYYYGVFVISIANPRFPVKVGQIALGGYNYEIKIQGDYAYVAQDGSGLIILNIKNQNPEFVSYNDTISKLSGLAIRDNYVYVTSWWDFFGIIDISNPANPLLMSSIDAEFIHELVEVDGSWRVTVVGTTAYIATGNGTGILIANIENPLSPKITGYYDVYNSAKEIVYHNDSLVLAGGADLSIIKLGSSN